METLDATVTGRVQGVGFRMFAVREARGLGLSGAVWNRSDGSVRVRASGPRAALEQFAARLAAGPSHADVRHVALAWSAGGAAGRFEVRTEDAE